MRDCHVSCSSCTERSEARQREFHSALSKTNETKKSVCDKRIIDAGVKRARTCPKGKEMYAYEKWKTHVRDVRSRLKHKCKLATIRPSKEGGRKKGEKRRKENVAVTSI